MEDGIEQMVSTMLDKITRIMEQKKQMEQIKKSKKNDESELPPKIKNNNLPKT